MGRMTLFGFDATDPDEGQDSAAKRCNPTHASRFHTKLYRADQTGDHGNLGPWPHRF